MIHKVFQQHIITEQKADALSIYSSDIRRRLQFKNKQTETCFELNCDRETKKESFSSCFDLLRISEQ